MAFIWNLSPIKSENSLYVDNVVRALDIYTKTYDTER